MFDSLAKKISGALDRLAGRDKIREGDLDEALRDIKIALLEADVPLGLIAPLSARAKEKALGRKILGGVRAAQQIAKIFNDEIALMLGGDESEIVQSGVILMAGLNGGGKTTSAAKIAKMLREKHGRRVLLASLDTERPQAREQLGILARRAGVDSLDISGGESPEQIAKRALGRASGYDILILDPAGRSNADEALMRGLARIRDIARPKEVLLSIDALVGQEGGGIAKAFDGAIGLTGAIVTRMDGDARAGIALSLRAMAGVPVKFLGTGEKLDDIEPFHPDRVASRILGMGDMVSLVERAQEKIDEGEARALAEKMFSGSFTFDDMLMQIRQMKKLGSPSGLLKFMPGISGMAERLASAGFNDESVKRQEAMILSMTPSERKNPLIILAGRKRRIAAGAGVTLAEVEKLLKQFGKAKAAMESINKSGGLGGLMEMLKGMKQGAQ
ncbi:MAG: signal recognition particle protein [Rickettsiales bacterium]|jgi:signal recognition particle subunit SRP54|nr:signal recognition particle protein [Rickettsiales bacterium]